MKYGVMDLSDGTYAVGAGRGQYFTSSVTSDKKEAMRDAIVRSMHWYYMKCEEAYADGVASGIIEDGTSMGDLLC